MKVFLYYGSLFNMYFIMSLSEYLDSKVWTKLNGPIHRIYSIKYLQMKLGIRKRKVYVFQIYFYLKTKSKVTQQQKISTTMLLQYKLSIFLKK